MGLAAIFHAVVTAVAAVVAMVGLGLSSTTTTTTTTTTAPPTPDTVTVTVTTVARTREQRCRAAIDAVLGSGLGPAPGFGFQCGPNWNTGADGQTPTYCPDGTAASCTGTIRIHPDDNDPDAHWRRVVRHEIGHSWCARERLDFSESCAQRYE